MADLAGTYDKRMKHTINSFYIEADLDWFPVTVHLTDSQGEEVFTELDADEDFDRIAFTTSDGETQLYADCELFDQSESKAIYHVSKDGWTVSSSADTEIYLYYDDTASHNTTYISKTGGTAAQNVWDGSFEAVYHMNDAPEFTDYDVEYDGSVEPDSDGWTLGGDDYASSDGDILTIDTETPGGTATCYYYKSPDVDFDNGVYIKLRAKIDATTTNGLRFGAYDGTQNEQTFLIIETDRIRFRTSGGNWGDTTFDSTDEYHIYELYIKGTTAKLYVDGTLEDTQTVESATTDNIIRFGDITSVDGDNVKCYIDYLNYALDIGYNPVGIVDATSNHNDGDKKAANAPTEATGKVGQGQDFDGSDDYVDCGDMSDTEGASALTVETIINADTFNYGAGNWVEIVRKRKAGGTGPFEIRVNPNDQKVEFKAYTGDGDGTAAVNSVLDTATWYHVVGVYDGSEVSLYINSVKQTDTSALTGNTVTTSEPFRFGVGRTDENEYFDGDIDDTRVTVDTARSAAWISATYSSLWDNLLMYGSEETAGEVKDVTGKSSLTTVFDSVLSKGAVTEATGKASLTTLFTAALNKGKIHEVSGKSNLISSFESVLSKGIITEATGKANLETSFITDLSKGEITEISGKSNIVTNFETSLSKGKIEDATGKSNLITNFETSLSKGQITEVSGKSEITTAFDSVLSKGKIEEVSGQSDITTNFNAELKRGAVEATGKSSITTSFTADLSKGKIEEVSGKVEINTEFLTLLSKGRIEEISGKCNIATNFDSVLKHSKFIEATGKSELTTEFSVDLSLGKLKEITGKANIITQFESILEKGIVEEATGKANLTTNFTATKSLKYKFSQATLGITSNQTTLGMRKVDTETEIQRTGGKFEIIE